MAVCFQILLSNPQMWFSDSDSETNSHQESPSQENIDQVSDSPPRLLCPCGPRRAQWGGRYSARLPGLLG